MAKNLSPLMQTFTAEVSAEGEQGAALPCFSSHENMSFFVPFFSAMVFAFLCFLLVVSLFKIPPKCGAEVVSSILSAGKL